MARYLWLADVLRDAGLTVHEVSRWRSRGRDTFGPVRGITCHHTAGSRTSSDAGELNVLINGRPGLSGPIAQLYLSRTGDWHVVASGHCNHNLVGWDGPNEGYGNDSLIGIEAQHSGGDEPWTDRQYNSYVRGVAALVRHKASGWDITVDRVAGHKEHQPGAKNDPSFNMGTFRARVLAELNDWEDEDVKPEDIAAIANAVWDFKITDAADKPKAGEEKRKLPARTWLSYLDHNRNMILSAIAAMELDEATLADFLTARLAVKLPDSVTQEELNAAVLSALRELFSVPPGTPAE